MGKRGGGWHTDNQKWQLWGGAKSPSQRPWRYGPGSQGSQGSQGFQDSRFPAFDAEYVELAANGHEIAKKEFDATGTDDGAYSMLQDLQSMLNNARKAENRVAKACKSRELTKAQWQRFEEKLRQTYQKEHKRFEAMMVKHEKEIIAAREAQAEARESIRLARPATPGSENMQVDAEDHEWERMKAKWEADQGRELGAVYRRALAVTYESPPGLPSRVVEQGLTTPCARDSLRPGAPFTGASPPAVTDPYLKTAGASPVASPTPLGATAGGARLQEDAAPSPSEPVRRGRPHTPRVTPYGGNTEVTEEGTTLCDKLAAAKRSALQPFGGPANCKCVTEAADVPREGHATILDDDPDELEHAVLRNTASPGLGRME